MVEWAKKGITKMGRADLGSSNARVGSFSGGLANEVCGSSDRNHGAQEEIKPPSKVCISAPPIMRVPREEQHGSALFHPTSHFARSAVAKNDAILLRYRQGLMRKDKRNWSARLQDVLDPGSVERLSPD